MEQDVKVIDTIFVLDKSLEITKKPVYYIDDCSFAEFKINDEKYNYWLKGPVIQTAHYVFGNNRSYLVSPDYKALNNVKEFIRTKIQGILNDLNAVGKKIMDENFD